MRLRTLLTHAGVSSLMLACSIGLPGCPGKPAEQGQPKTGITAAESVSETSGTSKPKPIAEVEDSVFDFGTMEVSDRRSHDFMVRNIGSATLVLEEGSHSCKCTSPEIGKRELEPGESTQVKVTWRIEEIKDSFEQYVTLTTNEPAHTELRLTIKGSVVQLFTVKPSYVWRAPVLGEAVKLTGTIASSILDQFEISKIESSDPLLTVKSTPLDEAELNADEMKATGIKCGYKIEAEIAAGVPEGDFRAFMTVHTTARGGVSLSIDVTGNRPSAIRIFGQNWVQEQMLVAMGTFPTREGKKVTLTMFYAGDEDLKFEEIVADPSYVKTTLERDLAFAGKGKTQKYKLTFEIPPGERAESRTFGTGQGSVNVKTNSSEVKDIHFKISFVSTQ